jgi:hypothetical protein
MSSSLEKILKDSHSDLVFPFHFKMQTIQNLIMISQVHTRVDSMALGKLSLNLTGCNPGVQGAPSPLAVSASKTIAKLLPRSHLMPLSLHSLNLASIAPRKDYAANRSDHNFYLLSSSCHQFHSGDSDLISVMQAHDRDAAIS